LYYASQNGLKQKNAIDNWKTLDTIVKKSITKEKVVEVSENELKLLDKVSTLEGLVSDSDLHKRNLSKNLNLWTEKDVVVDESFGDTKMIFEALNRFKKEKEAMQSRLEKEVLALKQKFNSLEKSGNQSLSNSFDSQTKSTDSDTPKEKDVVVVETPTEISDVTVPQIVAPPPMAPTMEVLNLPKLPTLKPNIPIKTFHCLEVAGRKIADTIFAKQNITENIKNVLIEEDELKKLFAITKSVEIKVKKQEEVITLLDQNRSYNVCILLKSLGSKYENIVEAILEMPKDYELEKITSLLKILPTPEEVEVVSRYSGTTNLAESDKFFLALKNIYNLKQRVECWYFKRSYRSTKLYIQPDLETILGAVKEMKESKQFFSLLEIVLAVANYMSGKKKVYGFKMASLVKLCDTKTADNKSNLLKYIADYIHRNKPDLQFIKELPTVPRAARVQLESIKSQIKIVSEGLNLLKDQLDNSNMDDEFVKQMSEFKDEVFYDLTCMNESYVICKKGLTELSVLFDDEQVIDKPNEFFSYISNFMDLYTNAEKDRLKSLEVAKKPLSIQSDNKKMEPVSINMSNVAEILRQRFKDQDE
jgi:hypothetical protein